MFQIIIFIFQNPSLLETENDDDSVIPVINRVQFEQYVQDGIVQGGMIPKLENAFQAIDAGVKEVVITQASAILSDTGTRIVK